MNPRTTQLAFHLQSVRSARSVRCPLLPRAGLGKAHQLFGSELKKLAEEPNEVLAA